MDISIINSFLVTFIAGLALIIGALLSLFIKSGKRDLFPLILSLTGGIMLFISFVDFLPSSIKLLSQFYSNEDAFRFAIFSFFFGLLTTTPVDMLLSFFQRKFLNRTVRPLQLKKKQHFELNFFIFLSITIHNFFDGIATFFSYFTDLYVAIPILVSIVAHNIPEGAVIFLVIFNMTRSKKKAFIYCTISALAGPFGAVVTIFILSLGVPAMLNGIIFAFLAGLIVNTALNELIPASEIKGTHQLSIKGIIAGMFFMAIIMIFFH
ncbi:MAG: ZIP family metal transporter [Bacteroidales bacterium]|nr:ZIP family metal transporter [Bacteroidales bacterium]